MKRQSIDRCIRECGHWYLADVEDIDLPFELKKQNKSIPQEYYASPGFYLQEPPK